MSRLGANHGQKPWKDERLMMQIYREGALDHN